MDEFIKYFRPRKLYIPKDTCIQIQNFYDRLWNLTHQFMVGVEQGGDERHPDRDTWSEVDSAMKEDAKPALEALEDDFRRLLGHSS
tara:strand:- start:17589 stop:17846 length:258 start_codon:yes stop_codon:yes gene_type:complete